MKSTTTLFCFLLFLIALSCKEKSMENPVSGELELQFEHVVNGLPLVLNTHKYRNASGEEFDIRDFRYYISNLKLRKAGTGELLNVPDSYYLIDTPENTHTVAKSISGIPTGHYDAITFSLGVDSAKNASTDNTGDLDPSNKMAWDWNTGYKFILLEGNYYAPAETKGLIVHVGTNPNYRTFTFELGQTQLQIDQDRKSRVRITTEIAQLFDQPHLIRFSEANTFMMGPNAQKVAENYSQGFFNLQSIENSLE